MKGYKMEIGQKVLCTKRLHGAFKKGHVGKITKIDDDIIEIDDIPITAVNYGKHFTKITGFWIDPIESRKHHIHTGDGWSLCGKWFLLNYEQPIEDPDFELRPEDCKTCYNKFHKDMK